MNRESANLGNYAESLYRANSFEEAFGLFESEVKNLGFTGVLYTYIPRVLIDTNFSVKPVYEVSSDFSAGYLDHYGEARFDRDDPLIKAVSSGESRPIEWWGKICEDHMQDSVASREVIAAASDYGIHNGITLPLLSGDGGISGASFTSDQKAGFSTLLEDRLEPLNLYTQLFHGMVYSNALYMNDFVRPLLSSLSTTEKRFLIGLSQGKTPAQIATDLNRNEKYLEQVMLKIRRKFSGVESESPPLINRNQVMYYAGLLNILEQPGSD